MLDRVSNPADLKGLPPSDLAQLADELRAEMVSTVTRTGGHLASSLGAVELTIALHRVFDSPTDKIIWDVGHQSYAHKMLTGRKARFDTLRQYRGISGFPDRDESPHDAFGTGHASTSISAALGLNQAGHLGHRIIVVLNDNAMAISPSVGALSRTLNKLALDPRYYRAKLGAGRVIQRMPWGRTAFASMHRLKSGLREMLVPTQLWETLGLKYLGPVNGHDVAALEEALVGARDYAPGPVCIHVVTTKGKGYEPAEDDCIKFHGVAGNVNGHNGNLTYSEVFARTLLRLFREDDRLVVITAAMMEGTGLNLVAAELARRDLRRRNGQSGLRADRGRLLDLPAARIRPGAARRLHPEPARSVRHRSCRHSRRGWQDAPGFVRQGSFDLSYLGCIPNLVVAAPRDENELARLVYSAARAGRPMAVRYPRGSGVGLPRDEQLAELPIGKGELIREGDDLAIIAIGYAVYPSLEAALSLEEKGISCAVVDARYAKPLDSDLILEVARRAKKLGLLSGETAIDVHRIGIPDEFVEHGSQDILRAQYGLDSRGIVQNVLSSFPEFSRIGPPASTKR